MIQYQISPTNIIKIVRQTEKRINITDEFLDVKGLMRVSTHAHLLKTNYAWSSTSTFLLLSAQCPAVKARDNEVLIVDLQMAS